MFDHEQKDDPSIELLLDGQLDHAASIALENSLHQRKDDWGYLVYPCYSQF